MLEHEEGPEARFGLGVAVWWLGEPEASIRCRERSYESFAVDATDSRRYAPPSTSVWPTK